MEIRALTRSGNHGRVAVVSALGPLAMFIPA